MSNDAKRLAQAEEHIAALIETLEEDGQGILDVVTEARWFMDETPKQSPFRPVPRSVLISQLRFALGQATSPRCDVIEFDLGNTDFSFEYEENSLEDS
jgi:hypothetical protein